MHFNYLFGITMMVLKLGTLRIVLTSSKMLSVAVAVTATIGTRLTIDRRRRTSVYFFLNVLPLKCINILSISKNHSEACQYTAIVHLLVKTWDTGLTCKRHEVWIMYHVMFEHNCAIWHCKYYVKCKHWCNKNHNNGVNLVLVYEWLSLLCICVFLLMLGNLCWKSVMMKYLWGYYATRQPQVLVLSNLKTGLADYTYCSYTMGI